MGSLYKRTGHVVERELGDGMLLLDMDANQIHQLNTTATFIWTRCNGCAVVAEIAASLAQEYDVDEDVATRDVEMTLSKLQTLDLVAEAQASTRQERPAG